MKDRVKLQLLRPYDVKYRLKKVEKPLIESISESLFGKQRKRGGEEGEGARKPINLMQYAPVIFGLLVFAAILVFIMSFASQITALFNMQPPTPGGSIGITGAVFSDYGNYEDKRDGIVNTVNVSLSNGSTAALSISVTTRPISKDIYIVLPEMENSPESNYSRLNEFVSSFSISARAMGLNPVPSRSIDLSKVPDGSTVVFPYVAPNGYLPESLISQFQANSRRHITFIYIGIRPDFESVSGTQADLRPFWSSLGMRFQTPSGIQIKQLGMRNALYTINDAKMAYDAVSVVQPRDSNWFFVFIPNSIDNGWDDGRAAAQDALKVASSFDIWAGFQPQPYSLKLNATSPMVGQTSYISSNMFKLDGNVFELLRLDVYNQKNQSFSFFELRSAVRDCPGTLYLQEAEAPKLLLYSISGQGSRLELLANGTSGASSDTAMSMSIISANGTLAGQVKIDQSALGSPVYFQYINKGLGPEPFLFEVNGAEEYARTFVQFGGLDVKIIPNFNDARFVFNFSSQGRPQEVTSAKITFKDKVYSFSGRRTNFAISMSDYFGGSVPVGKYNFTVEAGDYKTIITVTRPDTTGLGRLFSPTNVGMAVISLLIYVMGVVFAKKEEYAFSIDIPDFPSIEAIKIPISKDAFLGIFNGINELYKWSYTPVSVQDIKRQLSNTYFKGSRVYASDFNIEYILDQLKKEGLVKEEMDLYGLVSWEKDSGFTVRQLAMFRHLRDMCIENTIPFSEIGRTKGYHVDLKFMWNSFFVYFYEPKELKYIKDNFRKIVKDSLVFIVLEDDIARKEFLDSISDGSTLSSILKFYIDTGDVMTLTLNELENKLKQLKG